MTLPFDFFDSYLISVCCWNFPSMFRRFKVIFFLLFCIEETLRKSICLGQSASFKPSTIKIDRAVEPMRVTTKQSQKRMVRVYAKRSLPDRLPPKLAHSKIWPNNQSFRISCQSVKGFKFYVGLKSTCSHEKTMSSLTVHCITVHACDQ
jgi:hypothetical protein